MLISKVFSIMYAWLPLIIQGTLITITVSLCALIIGATFGTVFGIGNCNKLKRLAWSPFISFYVLVIRGTPLYVQALIVYYALPELIGINLAPLSASVLALGCNSIAYVTGNHQMRYQRGACRSVGCSSRAWVFIIQNAHKSYYATSA